MPLKLFMGNVSSQLPIQWNQIGSLKFSIKYLQNRNWQMQLKTFTKTPLPLIHLFAITPLNSSSLPFFPSGLRVLLLLLHVCERPGFVLSSSVGKFKTVTMTFIIYFKRRARGPGLLQILSSCMTTNLLCKLYLPNEWKDKSQPRFQIIPNSKLIDSISKDLL